MTPLDPKAVERTIAALCRAPTPQPNKRAQFEPSFGSSELATLKSALERISPDAPRGNGSILGLNGELTSDYWLGVIWAIRGLGGDEAEPLARAWSRGSSRYTDEGFDKDWAAFDPHHPNPVTIKSVYELAKGNGWTGQAPTSSRRQYKLLDRAAIMALPPMVWRVKGLFPEQGIGAIDGPSGSGKSFVAIDLALCVATGQDWFGRRTAQCPVTYVMLEGEAGLRLRIEAYERARGTPISPEFTAIIQPFELATDQDVAELAEVLPHGGVVILDTLNRAAAGKDENSSKDMGEVLAGMKRLQQLIGGLVLIVHHTGKDASKGMRGHSSLHAALDGAIEVKIDAHGHQWSTAKVKDGPDDIIVPFKLQVVDLGFDPDGEPAASCVIGPDATGLFRPKSRPSGKPGAVYDLISANPNSRAGISYDEMIDLAVPVFSREPRNKWRNRAARAIDQLVAEGFVRKGSSDGQYELS